MTDYQTIKNVLVPECMLQDAKGFGGRDLRGGRFGDLQIRGGRVAGMKEPSSDAPQSVLLSGLTECHVHLDKCLTIDRIDQPCGTLAEAMDAQWQDKTNWTVEDIRRRACAALDDLVASGVTQVRTHVDWTYGADAKVPPMAWHVLCELAQDYKHKMTVQVVPLVSIECFADFETAEAIAAECVQRSPAIGAFVLGQAELETGVENLFSIASKHGLCLDFHVDEDLDPLHNGLEIIADTACRSGFEPAILCGHACSLGSKPPKEVARISGKVAEAGISIVVLPTTNLYLQGRDKTQPERGMAPMNALQASGVNVVIGTDNVQDAFYPLGRFDPFHAFELAVATAHLPQPVEQHLGMISVNASQAMGETSQWVDRAEIGQLQLFEARSIAEISSARKSPISVEQYLRDLHT